MSQHALPAGPAAPTAPAAGVTATWNYTLGSIVFLLVFVDFFIVTEYLRSAAMVPSWLLVTLVLLALLAAASRVRTCWFFRDGLESFPPLRWGAALAAPAIVSWALAFIAPEVVFLAAVQLWLSASVLACLVRKPWRTVLLGGAFAVTALPIIVAASRYPLIDARDAIGMQWFILFYAVLMPFMLLTSLWVWQIVRRLDESRHLAAELAVTRERLRFAADLHDIQGHHLQVIALKAELAERTLEADPPGARAQVGEIRGIAKEAMEETRALVAGLREVSLTEELENARDVIELAGARCSLAVTQLPARPTAQRAIAFAVREATTNILRHSTPTAVSFTLGRLEGATQLTVVNDGVDVSVDGGVEDDAGGNVGGAAPELRGGSGLHGLRERTEAAGGTLATQLTPDGDAGSASFTLTVRVPDGGTQ